MKTVILAAGIGSRLKPLTDHTPKCLLKIGNKSILELAIENILATTDSEIIIVTGYLGNKIREFMGIKFPELRINYIHNSHFEETNNIYSLWMARDSVLGDDMMMMDSDIVFDKQIITKLLNSGYKNCLALKRHDVHDEEIKVKTDGEGKVVEIGKEVKLSEASGESIGIEIFGREALTELYTILERKVVAEKKVNIFYEAAFQELSENDFHIVDSTEYFCMEIDTAEDLTAAEELVLIHLEQNKRIS
jgi:choline kinase